MLTCRIIRFISLLLLGLCCVHSGVVALDLSEVHCVVDAVVAMTVMYVLLFVWDVSVLRECEGNGNAGSS